MTIGTASINSFISMMRSKKLPVIIPWNPIIAARFRPAVIIDDLNRRDRPRGVAGKHRVAEDDPRRLRPQVVVLARERTFLGRRRNPSCSEYANCV